MISESEPVESPVSLGEGRDLVLCATRCPQCAGPLRMGEARTLKCDHCGVRLLVQTEDGYSRWLFRPRVERIQVVVRAADWLHTQPGILKAARKAQFVEARLLYVPIWEYRALVVGWEFGRKMRTRLVGQPVKLLGNEVGGEERLELECTEESVREGQLHERRFYQSAADLDSLGVNRPRITGREFAVPFLPGEIDADAFVLEAEGSAAEITDAGRKVVLAPLSGTSGTDAHLFAIKEATTLLYYPLWSLHYLYKDRRYGVMVDGRSGVVQSGRAPAGNVGRIAQFIGVLLLLAVILAVLAHALSASSTTSLTTVAVSVIVSVAALTLAWRFRLQREVEYHEPFSS